MERLQEGDILFVSRARIISPVTETLQEEWDSLRRRHITVVTYDEEEDSLIPFGVWNVYSDELKAYCANKLKL